MTTPQPRRHERYFPSYDQAPSAGSRAHGLGRGTSIPVGVALTLGLALAWPAVGSAASCTISPSNPTINMGGSVSWTNTRSGFPSGT